MLNSRSIIRRCAVISHFRALGLQSNIQKLPKATYSSVATPNTKSASDVAKFILDGKPAELKNSHLTALQGRYLQSVGKQPSEAQIAQAFDVFNRVLSLKMYDRFSCARLTLMCLNNKQSDRALEPWTRLLEALGRTMPPAAFKRFINGPDYEPAALAALVSYFVIAGPAATPEVAAKLVPRTSLPANFLALRGYGGIHSKEAEELALRGLANLVSYNTDKFTSPEFLKDLSQVPFAEAQNRWKQVQLALSPAEIPEVTYAAFIRRFADTKQTQKAFNVWQQLVTKSGNKIGIDAWAALLRAAVKAPVNSVAIFASLWDKMLEKGYKPDASCYVEKFFCLVMNGKAEQAILEFKELQKEQESRKEGEPTLIDTQVLDVITTALARRKRFTEVDQILDWARQQNLPLNGYTFNPILEAASHDNALMQKYFSQMVDMGVQPDIVTYTFAANRLLKMGLPVDNLLAEMERAHIKPNIAFNTALAFTIGKETKNVKLSREVMDRWVKERQPVNLVALGAFVDLELKYGDVDRAVLYCSYTSKFGLPPSVPMYNQIIRQSIKRDRLDVALNMLETLTSKKHQRLAANTFTFMHLFEGWSLSDLQSRSDVQNLVKVAMEKLLARPNVIDFPLGKRVNAIFNLTGNKLVPPELHEIVNERLLQLYNKKLAPKH